MTVLDHSWIFVVGDSYGDRSESSLTDFERAWKARAAADRRADEAQRQLATVVAARDAMAGRLEHLAVLARLEHDDTNRGCGKAWGYVGPCTCGADEHNAKLEALFHA